MTSVELERARRVEIKEILAYAPDAAFWPGGWAQKRLSQLLGIVFAAVISEAEPKEG